MPINSATTVNTSARKCIFRFPKSCI